MLVGTELPEETMQGAKRPPWWDGENKESSSTLLLGGTESGCQERGSEPKVAHIGEALLTEW